MIRKDIYLALKKDFDTLFEEVLAGDLDMRNILERKSNFWHTILGADLGRWFLQSLAKIDIKSVNEKLEEIENKYNLSTLNTLEEYRYKVEEYSHYYEFEIKDDRGRLVTKETFEDYCKEYEEFKKENNLQEYENKYLFTDELNEVVNFGKDVCLFINNGSIPEYFARRYYKDALRFRQIVENGFEVSPEEKLQFEEEHKEAKTNELLTPISNEKAKRGWKYLLKKEVVVYNVKSGYLELSKEYMGKGKGGQEMLAFIGSYLADKFEYIAPADLINPLERVVEYRCTNKIDVCDMIAKLFGVDMRKKVIKCLENGRIKGNNNGFVSPQKSSKVYEILKKFENEYEIKNK